MILAQADEPLFEPDWVIRNLDRIGERLVEHAWLTLLAVGIGLAISVPVGIYAYRHRRIYGPVTSFAGFLYTIPSLALFVILIPYTGLTTLTAEIGLVSYTLLILIRNVVAGLDGVPEDTKEAARGMGYTDRQLLLRIELPLAFPVILAGIRVATVTIIGLVTVTSLIGKGGVGYFILQGLRRFFNTPILVGAALSVVLAVLADVGLLGLQKALTPWTARVRARAA
ncbi:MAG TPA: ABC transporter permease [Actinomycetota bacterium]|nr:ABC transporter permease [Actinomycetota bacterium]